ncbi:MAG: Uncharacterized protein G01um10148_638 [Parcubacteria group bacterium Gr01-1014_8]|nr:MAG: Uncharacterized protein G01um10148_638 [Parcubacteria group bacterium Gr01-1014_8]
MNGGSSLGDAYWAVVHFFESVTLAWFYDAGYGDAPPPSPFTYDPSVYPEPTPIVQSIQQEVTTGWSVDTILNFWGPIFPLATFLSLVLGAGIIYCVVRILQIRRIERTAMAAGARPIVSQDLSRTQLRWRRIWEQVNSEDVEKWRLAILEADIMLNDLLDVLGYKGETMADKMKQIPIEAFNSIDFAWEAHKIRNRVVHDSANVQLDAREAKRVIRMYERVFREFKYIE